MSELRIQELNEMLAVLTKNIGLPELGFSDDGYCAIGVESGRIIHLQQENDQLLFFAELGVLNAGAQRAATLEELLRANAFWVGTNGSTLSLAPDSGQVLLARRETIDALTAKGIETPLGDFIESAEYWATQLENAQAPLEEPASLPQPLFPGHFV